MTLFPCAFYFKFFPFSFIIFLLDCCSCEIDWVLYYIQHGMLKHKGTYEIMSPEDIGLQRADESGLVLGKLRSVCGTYFQAFFPDKVIPGQAYHNFNLLCFLL